ncbi:hypothetical protein Pst134EA_019114 [Puccinia striiformis f. sp. tritici]|uniref:hypothetical protein n=1 Tax=Puccinia striiformis f. sp. tritici TaxID=168172 RepID=UPI0020079A22|nr:hypothetical protein Pst134EA_019114 [Puccinia striiformis f. sp. tritici]KAH9458962.1 hypothetical protein Pst134EA_019114 [Puccinia striiformis f. sp. tritici]
MDLMRRNFLLLVLLLGISESRQEDPLKVKISTKDDFCLVVPKDPYTKIGDSEKPGGEAVWCQDSYGKTSPSNGVFNGKFWTDVEISKPQDGVIQMTGCINVNACDRLNPKDDGGQYDSNGGTNSQGNPAGSYCGNYHSYVQLIEPAANRACIRCCANPADCNLSNDERGCPVVVPGKYFTCG